MAKIFKLKGSRPQPPADLGKFADGADWPRSFAPAPELRDWVFKTFIDVGGALENPDYAHLVGSSIGFLWASGGFEKAQRFILGQCELVAFRCGGWQRRRLEEQMHGWFGSLIPDFLITLDGAYCRASTDAEFCALIEHELHHIGQELKDGAPQHHRDTGLPKLCMRGHDVEEFVNVVERYGIGDLTGPLSRMVAAAKKGPQVSGASIARACGTCLAQAA